MTKSRILYFDIETAPLLSHTWNKWVDGSVVAVEREWNIICVAWQWDGEKKINVESLRGKDPHDDTDLVLLLWNLFSEADFIIAHNGDKFDIPKVQARFLLAGLEPPRPFKSIDTLRVCRRHFKLTSNRLTDVCQALDIGKKTPHTGWELWAGCLAGDDKSWALMEKYNKQDIVLLRELYLVVRPWISNHPVVHVAGCPVCGSSHVHSRGTRRVASLTYPNFQCQSCFGWFLGVHKTDDEKPVFKGQTRR